MNYASTDSLCKGDLRGDDDKCKAQETDKAEWDKYVEHHFITVSSNVLIVLWWFNFKYINTYQIGIPE